ncbi:MAG: oligosaccharide flippase family protein [Chromatiaceae bacterium]|nr:oligosaccharide flippase family protein [Chromatiaceae bacterium]
MFFHYFTILYAILSGVVLVPLYLQFLSLDVYGAWLAASNVIAWMSIVDPGLSSVIMQKASVAYGREDAAALNGLLTNGVVLSLLLALVVVGAGWAAAPYLMSLLNLDTSASYTQLLPAFLMAVLGTALLIFSYGITAFNQGLQSSLGIGLVFMVTQLASLVLTVWLFYEGWGLMALALPMVFRGAGLLLGNMIYLAWRAATDGLRLRPSFAGFRELTRLMTYTFLGKAVGTIAASMDALIVTRYLGPEAAPVYMLTRKVPDLSRTFLERPAMAFMPAIGSLWGTGDTERTYAVLLRLMQIILWIMGLVGVGFWLLNGAFIKLWVGADLYAGSLVNSLIILQIMVLVFASALSSLCYALGNIKGNSIAQLIQGLVSIPLMIVGAHYHGLVGVVVAPIIATLLVSGLYYPRVFVRLLQIGRRDVSAYLHESIRVVAAALLTAWVFSRWSEPDQWWSFTAVVLAMTSSYALILLSLSPESRREYRGVWRRLWSC